MQAGGAFVFQRHRQKIDWKGISGVDVERVVRDTDIEALQACLETITYADLEAEDLQRTMDPNFLKLFRLAQLMMQYLLYTQEYVATKRNELLEENQKLVGENETLKNERRAMAEKISVVSKESRSQKKLLTAYEVMLRAWHSSNSHQCKECGKVFRSHEFLAAHFKRRHPTLEVPEEKETGTGIPAMAQLLPGAGVGGPSDLGPGAEAMAPSPLGQLAGLAGAGGDRPKQVTQQQAIASPMNYAMMQQQATQQNMIHEFKDLLQKEMSTFKTDMEARSRAKDLEIEDMQRRLRLEREALEDERRRMRDRKETSEQDTLRAELERLRHEKADDERRQRLEKVQHAKQEEAQKEIQRKIDAEVLRVRQAEEARMQKILEDQEKTFRSEISQKEKEKQSLLQQEKARAEKLEEERVQLENTVKLRAAAEKEEYETEKKRLQDEKEAIDAEKAKMNEIKQQQLNEIVQKAAEFDEKLRKQRLEEEEGLRTVRLQEEDARKKEAEEKEERKRKQREEKARLKEEERQKELKKKEEEARKLREYLKPVHAPIPNRPYAMSRFDYTAHEIDKQHLELEKMIVEELSVYGVDGKKAFLDVADYRLKEKSFLGERDNEETAVTESRQKLERDLQELITKHFVYTEPEGVYSDLSEAEQEPPAGVANAKSRRRSSTGKDRKGRRKSSSGRRRGSDSKAGSSRKSSRKSSPREEIVKDREEAQEVKQKEPALSDEESEEMVEKKLTPVMEARESQEELEHSEDEEVMVPTRTEPKRSKGMTRIKSGGIKNGAVSVTSIKKAELEPKKPSPDMSPSDEEILEEVLLESVDDLLPLSVAERTRQRVKSEKRKEAEEEEEDDELMQEGSGEEMTPVEDRKHKKANVAGFEDDDGNDQEEEPAEREKQAKPRRPRGASGQRALPAGTTGEDIAARRRGLRKVAADKDKAKDEEKKPEPKETAAPLTEAEKEKMELEAEWDNMNDSSDEEDELKPVVPVIPMLKSINGSPPDDKDKRGKGASTVQEEEEEDEDEEDEEEDEAGGDNKWNAGTESTGSLIDAKATQSDRNKERRKSFLKWGKDRLKKSADKRSARKLAALKEEEEQKAQKEKEEEERRRAEREEQRKVERKREATRSVGRRVLNTVTDYGLDHSDSVDSLHEVDVPANRTAFGKKKQTGSDDKDSFDASDDFYDIPAAKPAGGSKKPRSHLRGSNGRVPEVTPDLSSVNSSGVLSSLDSIVSSIDGNTNEAFAKMKGKNQGGQQSRLKDSDIMIDDLSFD